MQLEDYFDFLAPDDIRIKGHRVGIEHVLYEYIHRSQSAEQIAAHFDTLTLEQVYATILYYLHDKDAVSRYLADWIEFGRQARADQPSPSADLIARLQRAKADRLVSKPGVRLRAGTSAT